MLHMRSIQLTMCFHTHPDSVNWTKPWTCDSTTFKTASRVGECTSDGVPVEVTQTVNGTNVVSMSESV